MIAERPPAEIGWEQRLLRHAARRGELRPEYQELKFTLHRKLLDQINLDALAGIENDRIRSEVRQAALTIVEHEPTPLTAGEKEQLAEEVLDEVFGLGPLEPLLEDATISDILVNGHAQVYVERRGLLEETSVRFHDDQHLLRIIDKIVSQVGRRVDESNPMVDARLSDGSRVNAIIPPLAVDGPLLSIRRFSTDKLMPKDLVARLSLTPGMMQLLEAAVRARLNIIVSGGTGAGKTTLLNALSVFISPKERIVTIEDENILQGHHIGFDAGHFRDVHHAPRPVAQSRNLHQDVHSRSHLLPDGQQVHVGVGERNHHLQPRNGVARAVGVHRGERAVMARIHGL